MFRENCSKIQSEKFKIAVKKPRKSRLNVLGKHFFIQEISTYDLYRDLNL